MTTREKFQRRVIELIHGLPYEEALDIEWKQTYEYNDPCVPSCVRPYGLDITIGRVMKAIIKLHGEYSITWRDNGIEFGDDVGFVNWKFTNQDGSECTDEDQSDETIEELYELIK